jgi:hypothetical protein
VIALALEDVKCRPSDAPPLALTIGSSIAAGATGSKTEKYR